MSVPSATELLLLLALLLQQATLPEEFHVRDIEISYSETAVGPIYPTGIGCGFDAGTRSESFLLRGHGESVHRYRPPSEECSTVERSFQAPDDRLVELLSELRRDRFFELPTEVTSTAGYSLRADGTVAGFRTVYSHHVKRVIQVRIGDYTKRVTFENGATSLPIRSLLSRSLEWVRSLAAGGDR